MNLQSQTSLKFIETQKQFLSIMFSGGWGQGYGESGADYIMNKVDQYDKNK